MGTLGNSPGCLTHLPLRDENWVRASMTGEDGVGQGGEGGSGSSDLHMLSWCVFETSQREP